MQDYSLYHQFLFFAVLQCAVTTVIIYRHALPIGLHVCHLAPTAIALTMYYIFTMNEGATVAQFAVAEPRRSMWSLWVGVFPLVIVGAMIWAAGNLIGLLVVLFRQRRWTARATVCTLGLAISVLAFFAAASNFPTA